MTNEEAKQKSVALDGREVETVKFLIKKYHQMRQVMEIDDAWESLYMRQIFNMEKKFKTNG